MKSRLDELGMSQADLARKSGLSTGYVSNIVNGQRGKRVSAETAHRLARALRVRPTYILGDATQKQNANARRTA